MFLFSTITLLNSLTDKSGLSLFNKEDGTLLFKGEGLYQVDEDHLIEMFKNEGHKEYRDIVDITNLEEMISDPTKIYRIEFYIESNANADPLFSNSLSRKSKTVFVEFNSIDSFYVNLNRFLTMTYGSQLLNLVGELDGEIADGKSTVTSANKTNQNNYLMASNCYIRVMNADVLQADDNGKFYSIGKLDIYHGSEGLGTQEDILKNYILPTGYNNRLSLILTTDLPLNGALYDLFIIRYFVNRGNLGIHAVGLLTITETLHCFWINLNESLEFELTINNLIESSNKEKEPPTFMGLYVDNNNNLNIMNYKLGDPIMVSPDDGTLPVYLLVTDEEKNKFTNLYVTNEYDEETTADLTLVFQKIDENIAQDFNENGLENAELYIGLNLCTIPSLAYGIYNNQAKSAKYTYDGVEYEITLPPPHDYSLDYLTFTALDSGTISFNINLNIGTDLITSISYSTDNGETWTTTNNTNDKQEDLQITVNVNSGDKILWKGNALQLGTTVDDQYWYASFFSSTCLFNAEGNVMSMLYGDNLLNKISLEGKAGAFMYLFSDMSENVLPASIRSAKNLILPATTLATYCYSGMFQGCTSLIDVPELPATTLTEFCYYYMFFGCTSLTTAPQLHANTLAASCCDSMFYNCTSLITAPQLPAAALAEACYLQMFSNCTSLTTAPELPATTLAEACYYNMFSGCTSLTTAPELPATTLVNSCYSQMFYGCTSLITAPELPATTLANECYSLIFSGCTSLTEAPELHANILANYCYSNMFSGCTSLTEAPELPATTLTEGCYSYMFSNCTSLNYIKCLATNISASYCTDNWVQNVSSTGTFVKADGMSSWTTGANGIPSGWTSLQESEGDGME